MSGYHCRKAALHCVTLRYRQGGPGQGQGVTALPSLVTLCYTALFCVTRFQGFIELLAPGG